MWYLQMKSFLLVSSLTPQTKEFQKASIVSYSIISFHPLHFLLFTLRSVFAYFLKLSITNNTKLSPVLRFNLKQSKISMLTKQYAFSTTYNSSEQNF